MFENACCAQLVFKEPELALVTTVEDCVSFNIFLVNNTKFLNTQDLNEIFIGTKSCAKLLKKKNSKKPTQQPKKSVICYKKCFVMSSWVAYMALPVRAVQVHNLLLVLGLADISRINKLL